MVKKYRGVRKLYIFRTSAYFFTDSFYKIFKTEFRVRAERRKCALRSVCFQADTPGTFEKLPTFPKSRGYQGENALFAIRFAH